MRARATSSCAWRTGRDTDASVAALVGQSALITGASRGIGAAVARALAVEGARVVLLARTGESLAREAAAIGELALPLPCDLASPAQVQRALEIIAVQVGTPDILVSNAGAFALGAVGSMSPEEAEQMLQVNLAAPYRLLHALVPLMRARGHGHVVTIGSVADRHAYPENAAYAASKFGARAMHCAAAAFGPPSSLPPRWTPRSGTRSSPRRAPAFPRASRCCDPRLWPRPCAGP
jgi:NAD(P)-dependent dehydrogenase (short-subunit alcohol dehydrogenase family)